MQKVIGEIFLDQVAFIATADDKIIDAVLRVDLHDVPENWSISNLNHRFGTGTCFFADPSPQAASQNYRFHKRSSCDLGV
ncbi:hypothetical protein D3C86_1825650 [compost metagenome]